MRLSLMIAPACLVLAGCMADESGQITASAPAHPASAVASAASPAAQAMVATFQPPANPPLPAPRPDFGDRPAVAAAPAQTSVVAQTSAPESPRPAPALMASGATMVPMSASPAAPVSAFAFAGPDPSTRTLVAFQEAALAEDHEDEDKPLDPGPAQPGQKWRIAYPYVKADCFPEDLKRAMNTIGEHFKQDVLVISGARGNGRRGSMHRSCRAADIRVLGVAPTALAAYAKTVPGINGVGTYRRSTVTHIDVRAERYAWRY